MTLFILSSKVFNLKHLFELAALFITNSVEVFANDTPVVLPYISDAPIRLGAAILSSENY